MGIYIGFLFLIFIQSVIIEKLNIDSIAVKKIKINKNSLIIILSCIELIILAGIRAYNIGADTPVYLTALDYYEGLQHSEILSAPLVHPFDFEWGYFLLTKICAWLSIDKTVFLFVIAILTYIPLFFFISARSKYPILSIFIYFGLGIFSYSLGIFRQMIACSIILLSIKYIEDRNLYKFLIVVFIASSFHMTALVVLPIYWLYELDLKNLLKLTVIAEVIFMLFGKVIISFIFNMFPTYSHYLNTKYDVSGGSYLMLFFLIIFVVLSLKFLDHKENKVSLIFLFLSVLIQTLSYSMNLFGRMVPYFSIHLIVLIPYFIENYVVNNKNKFYVICITLLLFFTLTIKDLYGNQYVTPYQFFWEKVDYSIK